MNKERLSGPESEQVIALFNAYADLWNEREQKVISREADLSIHNEPYPIAPVGNSGPATIMFEEIATGNLYSLSFYGPYVDHWKGRGFLRRHVDRAKLRCVMRWS